MKFRLAEAEQTKAERINDEYRRLSKIFNDVDERTMALISPLLQQLAFLYITTKDLQVDINIGGTEDSTKNGKKLSPDVQAYDKMTKEYSDIIQDILKILNPSSTK